MSTRTSAFALILFAIFSVGIHPIFAHAAVASTTLQADYPVRLSIPSLHIDAPIQGVGINTKGEMDVPSGTTGNVGWYKYGTVPGSVGSAVLDAHVFAAFAALKNIEASADMYVTMASGAKLHFVVAGTRTYSIKNLPSSLLFASDNYYQRLNLVTCAGTLTKDHSTYDHRLVVYTTLVS